MTSVSSAPTTITPNVSGKPFQKKSLKRMGRDRSCDLARTTTLEGAAVGSKKAKELAIVAGSSSSKGFTSAWSAAELITGSRAAATPMPEKIWTLTVTHRMMTKLRPRLLRWGTNCAKQSPIAMLSPDCVKPELIARLPPISSNSPKSNFSCTDGQVRSDWPGRTCEGKKKSSKAGAHANVESFTRFSPNWVWKNGEIAKGRMISKSTCAICTKPTMSSSREKGPTVLSSSSYSASRVSREIPRNFRLRT
mmetsp:Transcript_17161/g.45835  ORF Transcript_17161/g.45835 Transcript_17161/m.45835 type:complete len:250 (+) Transcript_17161:158-907(+)